GNLPPLVQTHGGVENDRDGNRGVVDGSKAGERRDIPSSRIRFGGGINFLRRAGLARRAVAFENRFLARAVQHYTLHHLFHLGCRQRRYYPSLHTRLKGDHLWSAARFGGSGDDSGRNPNSVVGYGR